MSMIATTFPLSTCESRPPPAADAGRRTYGFWATLAWFGAAVLTYQVVTLLCGIGYAAWSAFNYPSAAIDWNSPTADYIATALSVTAAASLLIYAGRRAGPSAFGYLGLTWPSLRHVFV